MSVVNFILSLARKLLAKESKGITTIPNKMAVEQKAGEIAATLQSAGLPLNRADEFIKSEQDLVRILNMIESTPPVMKEVPSGIRSTKSAKVFDMEGKEIDPKKGIMGGKQIPDDDLPPPGSRGGPDDIAAPVMNVEDAPEGFIDFVRKTDPEGAAKLQKEENRIKAKIEAANKRAAENIRRKKEEGTYKRFQPSPELDRQIKEEYKKAVRGESKQFPGKFKGTEEDFRDMLDRLSDDFAQGGRAGFKSGSFLFKGAKKLGKKYKGSTLEALLENPKLLGTELSYEGIMELLRMGGMMQDGGRAGFKDGMTRRTFLKLLGGMAAVPIVGKFFKLAKVGKTVKEVPMIKTDDVAGKPEWFDALVNKVIREGDDVTKTFATGERQSIHQKRLDDGSVVRVTEDIDDGAVRVEYESEANVFGDPVQMQYKKPLPDEGAPSPTAEFTTAESGPVGRQVGPDDYDLDIDEVGGTSIRDLDSDVSKLKEYATGQKPTMKELVQNIERRKKAKAISEDLEAQSDAVVRRQGEYFPETPDDDFASGGIARMLGE